MCMALSPSLLKTYSWECVLHFQIRFLLGPWRRAWNYCISGWCMLWSYWVLLLHHLNSSVTFWLVNTLKLFLQSFLTDKFLDSWFWSPSAWPHIFSYCILFLLRQVGVILISQKSVLLIPCTMIVSLHCVTSMFVSHTHALGRRGILRYFLYLSFFISHLRKKKITWVALNLIFLYCRIN